MNNLRKKSALNTYTELSKTKTEQELTLILAKSDAHYTPEEIEELVEEFYPTPEGGGTPEQSSGAADPSKGEIPQAPGPITSMFTPEQQAEIDRIVEAEKAKLNEQAKLQEQNKPEENKVTPKNNRGQLIKFTEYRMKPVTEKVIFKGAKEDVITGFKRFGDPVRSTMIEQRHADLLNAHVRQSSQWLFKEGDEEFVSIDQIIELGG